MLSPTSISKSLPAPCSGLLGHNGAGKTTAVRILTTLLAPTSGRAVVAGHDVAREPGAVRARIAVAGQEASLDERLTGRENLMLLGRLQRLRKARGGDAHRRVAGALRPDRSRRSPAGHLQRRDAAAAGPRRVPDRAPPRRVPRRAHHRAGPGRACRHVGRDRRSGDRRGRAHPHHAVPRGGRPARGPDRRAERRPHRGRGHAGGAQTPRRRPSRARDPGRVRRSRGRRLGGEVDPRARRVSISAPNGSDDLRTILAELEDLDVEEASLAQPTLDDAFFALA